VEIIQTRNINTPALFILMRVDLIISCLLSGRRVSAHIETRTCSLTAATLRNIVPVSVRPVETITQFRRRFLTRASVNLLVHHSTLAYQYVCWQTEYCLSIL